MRADEFENQVWGAEGFRIRLMLQGRDVRGDAGGLAAYPYKARLGDAKSVSDWKRVRLAAVCPDYAAEVLYADGSAAHGNALLGSVRATYADG